MLTAFLIGASCILICAGYWRLWHDKHPEAFALAVGLLLMWSATMAAWAVFPWVDARGVASPRQFIFLPPAHLILLLGGYHAAKKTRTIWAGTFLTIALGLLLADAWFWPTWWPYRDTIYNQSVYGIFRTYHAAGKWGIIAELLAVGFPGGRDGVLAVYRRAGLGVPNRWRHRL